MKNTNNLKIRTSNELEYHKNTSINSKYLINSTCNRTRIRHPIKDYCITRQYTHHKTHTSTQNAQPNIKSPNNNKTTSFVKALSLFSKYKSNSTSRRNSHREQTGQQKNILAQDKVSLESVRFSTQYQNYQPIIPIFTQNNSPKKSLKTSPDTKYIVQQETIKNKIAQKLSGHINENLNKTLKSILLLQIKEFLTQIKNYEGMIRNIINSIIIQQFKLQLHLKMIQSIFKQNNHDRNYLKLLKQYQNIINLN